MICTDKAPTYTAAIAALIDEKKLSTTVQHRQVKYLNNVIEGDHGRLKQILGPKGGGFKTPVGVPDAAGDGGYARAAQRTGIGDRFRAPEPGISDRGQGLRRRLRGQSHGVGE